jgi:hypothetical protein
LNGHTVREQASQGHEDAYEEAKPTLTVASPTFNAGFEAMLMPLNHLESMLEANV